MFTVQKLMSALLNVSKFLPLIRGTEVKFSDGSVAFAKVVNSQRVLRRPGLRFSKYIFETKIQVGGVIAFGTGEDSCKLLALEKSIAESFERAVFSITKNKDLNLSTTNGWASHVSPSKAAKSAFSELAERDAILMHWLLKKPMIEIDQESFPGKLKAWVKTELSLNAHMTDLRILVTFEGLAPALTAVLTNSKGHAVASHASAETFDGAVDKAMSETCRLASNLDGGHFLHSSRDLSRGHSAHTNPEDHGLLYAYHSTLPSWLYGEQESWQKMNAEWLRRSKLPSDNAHSTFSEIVESPLSVGFSTSANVQQLFFGSTPCAVEDRKINFKRLNLGESADALNLAPHFIS